MPDILNPNEPEALDIKPVSPPAVPGGIADVNVNPTVPALPTPVKQIDLGTIDPRFANEVTRPVTGAPELIPTLNNVNYPGLYRDNITQRNLEQGIRDSNARVESAGGYLLGMQSRVQQDYVAQQEQFRQQTQFIQKRISEINKTPVSGVARFFFGDSTEYANRRDVNVGRGQFGERGGGVFGALGYVFGSLGAQFTAFNADTFEEISPGKGAETYQKANDFTRSLFGMDKGANFVGTPRDEALRRYRKAEDIYRRDPSPGNRKQRDYFYDQKNLYDNPLSSKFYENVGADLQNLRRLSNNIARTAGIAATIDDNKPSRPSNNLGGWSLNPLDLLPKSSRAVLATLMPTNWGVGLNPWVNKPSLNQAQVSKGYRENTRAIWLDGRQFEDTNNPYTKDGLFYDSRRIVKGKDTYTDAQKVIGTVFSALVNPGDAVTDLVVIDSVLRPLAKKAWSALPFGKRVVNEVATQTPLTKELPALSAATVRPALPPAKTPLQLPPSPIITANGTPERLRLMPAKGTPAAPPAPRVATVRQIKSNAEAFVTQGLTNNNGAVLANADAINVEAVVVRSTDTISPVVPGDAQELWNGLRQVKQTSDYSVPWNTKLTPTARKYAPDWVDVNTAELPTAYMTAAKETNVELPNFIMSPPQTFQEHKALVTDMLKFVDTPTEVVQQLVRTTNTADLYRVLDELTNVKALTELAQVTGVSSALSVPHTTVRAGYVLPSLKFPGGTMPLQVKNIEAIPLSPSDLVALPGDVLSKLITDSVAGNTTTTSRSIEIARGTTAYLRQLDTAIDQLSQTLSIDPGVVSAFFDGGVVRADIARSIRGAITENTNNVLAGAKSTVLPAINPSAVVKRDVSRLTLDSTGEPQLSRYLGVVDDVLDFMMLKVENSIDIKLPYMKRAIDVIDNTSVTNDILDTLNVSNPLGGGRTYTPTKSSAIFGTLADNVDADIKGVFALAKQQTRAELDAITVQYEVLESVVQKSIVNDIINATITDDTITTLARVFDTPPVKVLTTNNTSELPANLLFLPVGKVADEAAIVNTSLGELSRLEQKVTSIRNALQLGDDFVIIPHNNGYTIVNALESDAKLFLTPGEVSTEIMGARVALPLSNDNVITLMERAIEALPYGRELKVLNPVERIPGTLADVLHNVEVSIPQVVKVTDYADIGKTKIPKTNTPFGIVAHGTVLRSDKVALVNVIDLTQRTGIIGDHITDIGYPTRLGVLSSREISALPKEALSNILEDLQGVQLEIIASLDRLNNAAYPAVAINNVGGVEVARKFLDYKFDKSRLNFLPTLGNPKSITETTLEAGKAIGYHGTAIEDWQPLRNPLTESVNNLGFGTYLTSNLDYAKGAANRIYDNTLNSGLDVNKPSVYVVTLNDSARLIDADAMIRAASVRDYLNGVLPVDIQIGDALNVKKPISVREVYSRIIDASISGDVLDETKARFMLDAFDEYLMKHGYDGVIDAQNNFIKIANADKTTGVLRSEVAFNPLDKHELGDAVLAKYKTEQAGMLTNALDFSRTIDNKFEVLKQAYAVLDDQIRKGFDIRVATAETINKVDDTFYGKNAAKDLQSNILDDADYMDDLSNVGAKVSDDLCDY